MACIEADNTGSLRQRRLQLALERELADDEQVLWQAMQLARLEQKAFGTYIFAIPWTVFALLWTALAAGGTVSMGSEGLGWIAWAFPLFGLPFIAIGLAMLARPFLPLVQKGRVLYAVTTQRVLRLSLRSHLTVRALPANRIGLIERRESRDGSGRLKMAVKIGRDSDGNACTEFFELGRTADVIGAHAAIRQMVNQKVA